MIWKDSFGAALSERDARQLVEQGSSDTMSLTDDGGGMVQGRLILMDKSTGKVALEQA
ncbi:hypothetical protein [Paenibacillus foliorum]|uniref:hypothetical protein n=1 Tax=Paenibacillus foliorum TaxID=2654974 RepID=UPI00149317CC|nr:hypothetical protein [Paenibacillus foliorum]